MLLSLALGGPLALAACSTPEVAARAVWMGSDRDRDGARTLFTYASGAITTSTLRPLSPDPGVDALPLLVELEPRGRGALVRGADAGWLHVLGDSAGLRAGYLDLAHRRALPLWLPGIDAGRFTGSGDALWWIEACPATLAVTPLAADVMLGREDRGGSTVRPLRHAIDSDAGKPARAACDPDTVAYELVSAADAPVVFVVEVEEQLDGRGARAGARVEALRFPTAADEPLALERLAEGRLPADVDPQRLSAARCPAAGSQCGVAAADPDGTALFVALPGPGCRVLRWEVASGVTSCALVGDASEKLQAAALVAAVSGEQLIFADGEALHRLTWRTGELESRALIDSKTEGLYVRVTQDGRAVVVVSTRGPLLRASPDAIELLSVEQATCQQPQAPVLAPSGRFAAWTCTSPGGEEANATTIGEVIRVSAGGLERFQGVPMWTVAIDDAGDLLLHSRGGPELSPELGLPADPPRNLYVLAGDGVLERIDGLEPDPEPIRGLSPGTYWWIAGQPL